MSENVNGFLQQVLQVTIAKRRLGIHINHHRATQYGVLDMQRAVVSNQYIGRPQQLAVVRYTGKHFDTWAGEHVR